MSNTVLIQIKNTMAACENCLISHSYKNREVNDLVSNIDIFTATSTSSKVEF